MPTDRYTWRDVQSAADHLFRSLSDAAPVTIPLGATGLDITPGSVTNGNSAVISWRSTPHPQSSARIPGGSLLPRSAHSAYDNLTTRAAVLDDLPIHTRNR